MTGIPSSFFSGLLSAGEALLPAIVPGAGTAIVAGQKLIGLIDEFRGHAPAPVQGQLAETRDQLEARVNQHADRTASSLG